MHEAPRLTAFSLEKYVITLCPENTEGSLFAFAYRLFHKDFSPIHKAFV